MASGSQPKCVECVALNKHRARDLPTMHCKSHGCPAVVGRGEICGKKKSRGDYGCSEHPPPPPPPRVCAANDCTILPSKPSPFCDLHKCAFSGCREFSNAGGHQDYCHRHKCSVERCQALRKRNQVGHSLKLALFCLPHECETNDCIAQKASRTHCSAHCCTFPNCPNARRTDLGTSTYCLGHFSEELRNQAAAVARRDIERQFQIEREQADIEEMKQARAQKLAEEKKKRDEEAAEAILRSHKVRKAEDEERRLKQQERERDDKTYQDRERARYEANYQRSRQEGGPSQKYNPHFYQKPTANDHRNDKDFSAKYSHNNSYSRNHAAPENDTGHYTAIPNRSVPKGGYQRDANGNDRRMDTDQSHHRRQERAKRNSDGSFVNVEVHQDDGYKWASDSVLTDSEREHSADREFSRSEPPNQRERGYSNEASAGSNVGYDIRDEGTRHKSREDKYHAEGRTRVRRNDREAAYPEDRKRQGKYNHDRNEEGRGGKENAKNSGW